MWLVESWFCKSLTYSGTPMEKRNKCGLWRSSIFDFQHNVQYMYSEE
jgi:hypothetical protein